MGRSHQSLIFDLKNEIANMGTMGFITKDSDDLLGLLLRKINPIEKSWSFMGDELTANWPTVYSHFSSPSAKEYLASLRGLFNQLSQPENLDPSRRKKHEEAPVDYFPQQDYLNAEAFKERFAQVQVEGFAEKAELFRLYYNLANFISLIQNKALDERVRVPFLNQLLTDAYRQGDKVVTAFAAYAGADHDFLNSLLNADLLSVLNKYKENREQDPRGEYFHPKYVSRFFGGYSKTEKFTVVDKLTRYMSGTDELFTEAEIKVLYQGNLGQDLKLWENATGKSLKAMLPMNNNSLSCQ